MNKKQLTKNKGKKTAWAAVCLTARCLAAVAIVCLLCTCAPPADGDADGATVTITIGSGSRSALSWDDSIDIDQLDHTIIFSGGPGADVKREGVKAGQTVEFTVAPGHWDISVKAYLGARLVAEGSESVNLKKGRNGSVSITMRQAGVTPAEETFEITLLDDGRGTATANPNPAAAGETVYVHAVSVDNYMFKGWVVISGGVTLSGVTDNPATFIMPAGAVTIKAEFEIVPPNTPYLTLSEEVVFNVSEDYSEPPVETVTIHNAGTAEATISSITLKGEDASKFIISAASTTTIAVKGNATFNIQPKAGCDVGTYTDMITVTYWGGVVERTEAKTDVRLIVHPIYTVTFNKNNTDSTGSTEANPATEKVKYPATTVGTLPEPPARVSPWFFTGWNTAQDGSGTNFTETTTVTAKTTVYAQWELRVSDLATWNAAKNAISSYGSGSIDNIKKYTINILADIPNATGTGATFGTAQYINVTITGDKTITLTGTGSLLDVGANQTVVIHDTKFKGNADTTNIRALFYFNGNNVSLTMEGNSSVSDNISSGSYGGGVYVSGASATFTMKNNAEVHDNTYTGSDGAGGVYVTGTDSTFIMQDNAKVHHNTGNSIGGVYFDGSTNRTFTMQDKAEVCDNIGIGVKVYGVDFIMKGDAKVHDNTGSGVSAAGVNFIMQDNSLVYKNTSTNDGGGVNWSTMLIGGVIYKGNFTMQDNAEVYGNTAASTGYDNGNGGGVSVAGGTFNMQGNSSVHDNEANKSGGGVSVTGGTFNMKGGKIYGNIVPSTVNISYSSGRGGGVYVYFGGKFQMETGIIYGSDETTSLKNTAGEGVALYKFGTAQRGTFTGTDGAWESKDELTNNNNTINVEKGDIVP